MQLDKRKSYGTVHGEGSACFVQNGFLFDQSGNKIEDSGPELTEKVKASAPKEEVDSPLKQFILETFSQGEMYQSGVFKMVSDSGLSWPDVQAEFEAMGGQKIKNKGQIIWKLTEDGGI